MIFLQAKTQPKDTLNVSADINFSKTLQDWDGFGFNYVQVSQTPSYDIWKQDYGGFSILDKKSREEILDLVFGEAGLKPGLIKIFLDPLHQEESGGEFDHETTTYWMRSFVKEGVKISGENGRNLQIITTNYSVPSWATVQKELRGRDLDESQFDNLAIYMIDWIKFLRQDGLTVSYISLHNQGDKPYEFPMDGSGHLEEGYDYNTYWTPDQVVGFIKFLRQKLDDQGLAEVGITPGETSRWHFFHHFGYADALADDPEALSKLGLITSHGFHKAKPGEWFGEQRSAGLDLIHAKRPEIHAWTTSSSWLEMNVETVKEIYGNIYTAKVNGYIPWAGIQRPAHWTVIEWNPGSAFHVSEDGSYEILDGYYFYKQVSRAGQPGMKVATAHAVHKEVFIIAFSANGTKNPDSFVLLNLSNDHDKLVDIEITGSRFNQFEAFRTTENSHEKYKDIGIFPLTGKKMLYQAPRRSVTTFFGL